MSDTRPANPGDVQAALTLFACTASKLCAVLIGNPTDGFEVFGPFADFQYGVAFLDRFDVAGWVVPMTPNVEGAEP